MHRPTDPNPPAVPKRTIGLRWAHWISNPPALARAILRPAKKAPGVGLVLQRTRLGVVRRELDRRARNAHLPDAARKLAVDPASIRLCLVRHEDKVEDHGQVLGGNWDLDTVPFEELDVFVSFKAHFQQGVAWNDTDLYERVLAQIESGRTPWGCTSKADLDARMRSLDDLYVSIRANGYKAQDELSNRRGKYWTLIDEVSVCISRSGELLFRDGRHRLTIAKLQGLKAIPVQVGLRHREWVDLRHAILDYAGAHGGKVMAPLPHPDLADIPSTHGHSRFEAIRAALPVDRGRLLDMGAHWGYFCHRFESLGFDCTAVEADPESVRFLRALREACSRRFAIHEGTVLEYPLEGRYDVVLALSVFHQFLMREVDLQRLTEFLKRLDTDNLVIEALPHQGPPMDRANLIGPEKFVAFVAEHASLRSVTPLANCEDDRAIFLLRG